MINLNELTPHRHTFHNIVAYYLPHTLARSPQAPNPLKSDLREARKRKTIREMTFAMRGNAKPFEKGFAGAPQIILFSPDRRNQ